jgi:metallo-beta-lactamase family protein
MLSEILHHGAINGVTGSCHELRVGDAGVLIDCGLFQGAESAGRAGADELAIEFPIDHIRALVITHVHIDHIGRLPYLLAAGYEGPILCSRPTALLLPAMLEDALKVGFTRDRALVERVLDLIRQRLVPLDYNEWHSLWSAGSDDSEFGTRCRVRLQRAGHILGSAFVEFEVGQGGAHERIVFSGDLGARHAPLLPEPQSPERADRLVIESTYGDRLHEDRKSRRQRLAGVLKHALADGGTVLIPAFSIGRTQDLLYELESLIFEHQAAEIVPGLNWGDLEIVIDSPLAATFTDLYRQLKPYWDEEAQGLLSSDRHPLSFEQITTINDHHEHLQTVDYLARSKRPCVVIAGSGMCTGGRIVNYLKALLGDKRNDVLFVGYQARGTPGHDILRYGPRNGWVSLDGERYPIQANIHQIGGYSAHADQADLLRFIGGIAQPPGEIRIVHGDDGAKEALQRKLEGLYPNTDIVVPVA